MSYYTEMSKACDAWKKEIHLDAQLLEARKLRDEQWTVLYPHILLKTSPPQEEIRKLMEPQRKLWEIENQIKDLHKNPSRMKKHIEITLFGKTYPITLDECKYYNGNTCIQLFTKGSPFSTLSVNLPESNTLPPGVFYAKYWSENHGIVEQLVGQGAIERVYGVPTTLSGFIIEIIAAYRLVNNK